MVSILRTSYLFRLKTGFSGVYLIFKNDGHCFFRAQDKVIQRRFLSKRTALLRLFLTLSYSVVNTAVFQGQLILCCLLNLPSKASSLLLKNHMGINGSWKLDSKKDFATLIIRSISFKVLASRLVLSTKDSPVSLITLAFMLI